MSNLINFWTEDDVCESFVLSPNGNIIYEVVGQKIFKDPIYLQIESIDLFMKQ